jgi:hypothetical protein
MKNISERANRAEFEGFLRMLYELKREELASTQIVLIDKEFVAPHSESPFSFFERLMMPNEHPDSDSFPPLIPYYRGH